MILWILKGEMPFKMHKIIFFPELKKNMCGYLKFSDLLLKTLIILFGLTQGDIIDSFSVYNSHVDKNIFCCPYLCDLFLYK